MSLRIRKLKLSGVRQFRDVTFDFTDPETGKPLDRICLIGGNGTGKSTLLRLLAGPGLLNIPGSGNRLQLEQLSLPSFWGVEFQNGEEVHSKASGSHGRTQWSEHFAVPADGVIDPSQFGASGFQRDSTWQQNLERSLAVFCPPNSEAAPELARISDVPNTNLDKALKLLDRHPSKYLVAQNQVTAFWSLIIALVKDREARLLEYQKRPENQERTIREVEEEFLANNPDILRELADLWAPILAKAGLVFDYEKASLPVQLKDNLKAYIRLLADDSVIPYAELSTGIRAFLFRLGHLFCIFRFPPGKGGIVLIDEPENSLYPDFQFELLEHYRRAAPDAQMFFATHSPIIAAQFRPEERFILEFDSSQGVVVRRGVTPEGDDPNDILLKDFAVSTLYGPKGLEVWQRFKQLDEEIQTETDPARRKAMLREYLELGRRYNFTVPDAVSS